MRKFDSDREREGGSKRNMERGRKREQRKEGTKLKEWGQEEMNDREE